MRKDLLTVGLEKENPSGEPEPKNVIIVLESINSLGNFGKFSRIPTGKLQARKLVQGSIQALNLGNVPDYSRLI